MLSPISIQFTDQIFRLGYCSRYLESVSLAAWTSSRNTGSRSHSGMWNCIKTIVFYSYNSVVQIMFIILWYHCVFSVLVLVSLCLPFRELRFLLMRSLNPMSRIFFVSLMEIDVALWQRHNFYQNWPLLVSRYKDFGFFRCHRCAVSCLGDEPFHVVPLS